jgi:nucleoid DNA-binding protein
MDIDLLSKMIKELILENDRVVLPGLGCFVAEMVPATFSDKGYTINPPYRRLSFRARPDMGDELIDFYVEANGLDREVACRILGEFIRELRQIIFSKKVVVLPGLGRLRATKENNLFFIPDEDLDIYPAGLGLEPISLKSHVETPQEVSAAISGLKSIMEEVAEGAKTGDAAAEEEVAEEVTEEVAEETVVEVVDEVTAEEVLAEDEAEVVEAEAAEEETAEEETVEEETAEEDKVSESDTEEEIEEKVEDTEVAVEKPKRSAGRKVLITLGVALATAAVLLGVYVGLSRLNPEIFDSILYSAEELEILNYRK